MRLRRLTINALPGITPGFTFAPPDAGVILITGPNAIGKSSLARALKHLLGGVDRRGDPPALSLAAEFDIGGSRWQVTRNGGQVVWMRDGEPTTSPSLPSAGQISLYRLSMESLLADDPSDQAMAEELWRALRGGFDLDAPRTALGSRWGRKEEGALSKARSGLGNVERRYAALRSDEAKLPALDRDIEAAQRAAERLEQLQQAMELHRAIDLREDLHDAVKQFPPDMDKLKGNELERLEACDAKDAELRARMQDEQRKLQAAQADWQDSGLADAAPEAETVARMEARLNALDRHAGDRARAEKDATEAEAALQAAQAQFQGSGEAPNLSADSLEQARAIVEPWVDAQARLRELQQQLKLAGEPPDDAEIDQHRAGVDALRSWLAAVAQPGPTRPGISSAIWLTASALAAIAAAVALIERAWSGLAVIVAAGLGLALALMGQAKRTGPATSAADDAMKAFMNTELDPPKEWASATVEGHLRRTVEPRLNELILQRERASVAPKLRAEIEDAQSAIERLGKEKAELAKAIGFNPELAGPPFYRLVEVASQWDQARKQFEASKLALAQLDGKVAAEAGEVRRFLEQRRTAEAPPFDATTANAAIEELRIAFNHLKRRLDAANDAQGKVASCRREVQSLQSQIKGVEKDVQGLLAEAALETHQRDELAGRIERLAEWKEAFEKLTDAMREESRLRSALAEHTELIAAVESGEIEQLKADLERARSKANTYTDVIKERQRIETQLDEAGREHDLERAAGALDAATATLEDKRDEALRSQATETLLSEIERQFRSQHEPDLLRRAKERFEQVTAHEFSLELRDGNRFAARDLKQGQLKTLEELSSGTRMQLLLALRLAWTEAQEQGGESLPLFLDEALTTSDEDRFAVMANTLTRLAEAGERQIFYLSARRHESALWRQATGAEPPVVDLAAVRFGTTRLEAKDFQVETPPSPPSPAGHDAASYAALLRVPRFDPHLEPGGIHLFHLLRDDLELLHRLMATWRIATLGQLDSLLASNAAKGAIPDAAVRSRLKQRCEATRTWTGLWRQGRGRPVNRAVLEQAAAITDNFIDGAAELADELQGDGAALIDALRQRRLSGFRKSKADEFEQWLADEGYTDNQDRLSPEARRRLTLAAVAPQGEESAADVNQLVDSLEGAAES
ncbi:MAG: AAA family ATPase [Gammaproteobacteria bacterium]|nr:AAA family ATPase [Gammaproteobacteria bacterium]